MDTISVKLESGPTRSVSVVSDYSEKPSFNCYPPHTALSIPTARIDRGENLYGSMAEDFYLLSDSSWDPGHVILWVGDNGSQADDDQPRLYLAAWAGYRDFWNEEAGEFKEVEAASVLLYAWIKHAEESWTQYNHAIVVDGVCKLNIELVARIMDQARLGEPLSLLRRVVH